MHLPQNVLDLSDEKMCMGQFLSQQFNRKVDKEKLANKEIVLQALDQKGRGVSRLADLN